MMRLAEPSWLLLAGASLLLLAVWVLRRRWQRYPFPVVDPRRGGVSLLWLGAASGALAAIALVPLAVSLARPQEVLSHRLERSEGIDIIVALDISGSMAALDFRPTDRLEIAKEVIDEFISGRPDDRIGVVVFAGAAVTVCPLTLDHEVARHLLERVGHQTLPDGTAIGVGLGTAVTRLRGSEASSKVVVLITDGSNNAGQIDPATAAELAASEEITVHTVLVGRGGEVPIPVIERDPLTGRQRRTIRRMEVEVNPELLAEIARATGGASFRARDAEALAEVFEQIDAMERTQFTSERLVRHRERFEPWAIAALLLTLTGVAAEAFLGRTPW